MSPNFFSRERMAPGFRTDRGHTFYPRVPLFRDGQLNAPPAGWRQKVCPRRSFADAVDKHLMPIFMGLLRVENQEKLQTEMRKEFARMKALDERQHPDEIGSAIAVAAEKEPFTTRADHRVRHWVDGLVIGSELFVKTTMANARGVAAVKKRKLVRALNANSQNVDLYCFKQLRVLLE